MPIHQTSSGIKAAGILFLTPDRQALFLKRSAMGDHAGHWGLPGGTAEDGEDAMATARREAREELRKCPDGNLMPISIDSDPDGVEFATFAQPVAKKFLPRLNAEHTEYRWAPIAQPPDPLHPGLRKLIDRMNKKAKSPRLETLTEIVWTLEALERIRNARG